MSTKRQVAARATTKKSTRSKRQTDARLRSVIELAADYYWEQDEHNRFSLWQPSSALAAPPRDLLDRTLADLKPEAPDGDWDRLEGALAACRPFRDIAVELTDGTDGKHFLKFSGRPLFGRGNVFKGYCGIAQDVTEEIQAARLVRIENAVGKALTEGEDAQKSLRRVLRLMCESQGWTAGRFWSVEEPRDVLQQVVGWCSERPSDSSVLRAGERLPSWLHGGPVWIGDIERDPRTARADCAPADGWSTALVVPIKTDAGAIGVLEFYAPRIAAPHPHFLRAIRAVSAEIGRFYQRSVAVEKLRESEERFSSTMKLAAIGIAHVDDNGRFIYVNPELCEMLGYTEQELRSMTVKAISHPDDVDATDELRTKLHSGAIASFKIEKRYLRKNGSPIWVGLTVAMKRDRSGKPVCDISVVEDISARKSAEERVQYLATHDGLTGLPNRAMFNQLLALAIETAKRYGRRLAVLFIDLDRFKIINDTLGHEAGDVLLREMGARLRECVRASDVVARLGGDEFVVLLHEIEDATQAATAARHVLAAIVRPIVILGHECRVTASIGVCVHPTEGQHDHAVLKNADMAMYSAKDEGKNNFQIYSNRLKPHSIERLALETNLRRALELQEFSLHYQAKVNFRSGAITGVEALLRWQSPQLGLVSPARFIPLAEETGLIVAIGRWVLRTACEQNVSWQAQGLPPLRMSVNLSMRQLNDENLIPEIESVLRETGMDPELLELEVTETTIMHNAERAVQVLTAIKRLGVRLAIDDFGTGYSSLAHLKRFPIDTLKVDRSFIREVPAAAEDRAITEAIIAMGKTLSLTVVAEGVETPEQQAFLSERMCDEMQGYYFSTPVAAQDFADLLRRHTPSPRR